MQYTASTPNASPATLAAATAKTVIALQTSTTINAQLIEFGVSFNGTNAAAEPVLVELCKFTNATGGTKTEVTPLQSRGVAAASAVKAFVNYTVEPTVLEPFKPFWVPPTSGLVVQIPLGRELEAIVGEKGLAIRCTAPAEVKARVYVEYIQGPS